MILQYFILNALLVTLVISSTTAVITCVDLPAPPAHGLETCIGNENEYNTTCYFYCDPGYERKGSSSRTCQADGQWSGSHATCEDTEPPVFTDCPNDIMADNITTPEIRINWQRPTVTDNSGVLPYISSNIQSGRLFAVPGSYEVLFTASDGVNVARTCSFRITLKRATCLLYPAPTNGVLACFFENGEPVCAVMCQSRLDFVRNPPLLYFCSNAQWQFYTFPGLPSYDEQLPWPNCSGQVEPSSEFKAASIFTKDHFFDGNASDPIVRDTISTQFIDILKAPYVPPPFCLFNPQCTEENVKLYVGASTVITCVDLPAPPAHGLETCIGNENEYNTTCYYYCDPGYERKGSSSRTCQADGQWSGSQATCEV